MCACVCWEEICTAKVKNEKAATYILHPEYICLAWSAVQNASQKPRFGNMNFDISEVFLFAANSGPLLSALVLLCSSGLVGVIVALNLCTPPLHLYGFAYERYFNESVQPHYFDW